MQNILHQGLQAILELKDKNCYHRDIKSSNFVYTLDFQKLILIDLGLAVVLKKPGKIAERKVVGTSRFAAPELLTSDNSFKKRAKYHPFFSDLYSLGIMILHLVYPFQKRSQQLRQIKSFKISYPAVHKLITILLDEEPSKREQILKCQKELATESPEIKEEIEQIKELLQEEKSEENKNEESSEENEGFPFPEEEIHFQLSDCKGIKLFNISSGIPKYEAKMQEANSPAKEKPAPNQKPKKEEKHNEKDSNGQNSEVEEEKKLPQDSSDSETSTNEQEKILNDKLENEMNKLFIQADFFYKKINNIRGDARIHEEIELLVSYLLNIAKH